MLDEFEIINWIKYIERFDLTRNNSLEELTWDIFFIALATKLIMNK